MDASSLNALSLNVLFLVRMFLAPGVPWAVLLYARYWLCTTLRRLASRVTLGWTGTTSPDLESHMPRSRSTTSAYEVDLDADTYALLLDMSDGGDAAAPRSFQGRSPQENLAELVELAHAHPAYFDALLAKSARETLSRRARAAASVSAQAHDDSVRRMLEESKW